MNKLILIFLILVILTNTASAGEISGNVASYGKKLADQKVTISRVNSTQSDETGMIYNFMELSDTYTRKDGNFSFYDLDNGMYRINVTFNNITYGRNILVNELASADFNLSGWIEGYVLKSNGTIEGMPVRLLDNTGITVMTAITDKSGKYSFNRVDTGQSYLAEAVYADVPYTKQANASESANFIVYDSTENGDVLSVGIDHIVLSRAQNGIKVDEYVEFVNTGDKVFFSKERVFVGISTPEGITGFQTDAMECCLLREKDSAWIDPMKPIMPGDTFTAQISYVFNPESSGGIFYKGMIYNTSFFTVLSQKNNGFGIDNKYAKKEIVPNEGKEFEVLSFMNIPKTQILDIRITGYVPSKSSEGGDLGYLIPAVAAILIGAVMYPLAKSRLMGKTSRGHIRSTPSIQISSDGPEKNIQDTNNIAGFNSGKEIGEMSFDELLSEKNASFESIMHLDNRFNSGEISEKEYKVLKNEYKEKAMQVIKQLKEAALNLDLAQPVPALEKMITHIGDIDILEELLSREKEGEGRDELLEIIEQRIDDIERDE